MIWIMIFISLPGDSFKIRGAMNAILKRKEESPGVNMESLTVVTCSAGNMGQAVSYAAKVLNCKVGIHVE